MRRDATLSDCGLYRYVLEREWDTDLPPMVFIGLNPSTADAELDDPTIRRCIRFARDSGHGSLFMLNLFAWRTTDPAKLPSGPQAVGPENDLTLYGGCSAARAKGGLIVCAWGANPRALDRQAAVCELVGGPLHVLRLTAGGFPHHPVRLPASCTPILWEGP